VPETALPVANTDSANTEKPCQRIAKSLVRQQFDEDLSNSSLPCERFDRITNAVENEADNPGPNRKGDKFRPLLDAERFEVKPLASCIPKVR
jgi:hypothetical protein